MKFSTLIAGAILLFSSFTSSAAPGDTTIVRALDHMDMTWNGTYLDTAILPSTGVTYNKILMVYTMGCATGGCSDWDYTTKINLYDNESTLDSTISSIDTISTNPLVIDTTWNTFEVYAKYELGRVITPYGGFMRQGSHGYSNNWEHPFVFDVTDFVQHLKDTVAIAAVYSGYSSGFSATVDFIFIEGTPARPVVQLNQIYARYGNYITPNQFESDVLPPVAIPVNSDAVSGAFRFTPTGHGFVNALNCAEFCNKYFTLYKDGVQMARHPMWRDDCGMNPIFPQGGTWLYDRANWCPGADANIFVDEIGSLNGVNSVTMNVDVQSYTYTVPSGETPAGYNLEGVLVQYDDFQIDVDAEVTEIIAPNSDVRFRRFNPACRQAIIKISNRGGDTLKHAVIHWGIPGSWIQSTHWYGNLLYNESEVVELPMTGPWPWENASSGNFEVRITAVNDRVAYNNKKTSTFDLPIVHPNNMVIVTRTNAAANETHWELYNDAGQVVASRDGLLSNRFYYDTLNLASGCYELKVMDRGKDGMSWWANNDGTGYVQLRNNGGSTPLFLKLEADFGTEFRHMFTVGGELHVKNNDLNSFLDVAPNPSNGVFEMLYSGSAVPKAWTITDLNGRTIQKSTDSILNRTLIDLSAESAGMYVLTLTTNEGVITRKLIVNK